MRKPNGYGSIKKLSGNRRRPFVFVISENCKQKPVDRWHSPLYQIPIAIMFFGFVIVPF